MTASGPCEDLVSRLPGNPYGIPFELTLAGGKAVSPTIAGGLDGE